LKDGSLVVNSSQGGGTKDTWVLADEGPAPSIQTSGTQTQTQSQTASTPKASPKKGGA
jgi:uncharacterized circularly permuted ATP-grasp superfamily protein